MAHEESWTSLDEETFPNRDGLLEEPCLEKLLVGKPSELPCLEEENNIRENIPEINSNKEKSNSYFENDLEGGEDTEPEDVALETYYFIGLLLSRDDGFPPLPREFLMATSKGKSKCQVQQSSMYELVEKAALNNIGASVDTHYAEALESKEEMDTKVIRALLSAAESIGAQKYDYALQMILHCKRLSTPFGNPVERIGYYFSEALEEKVEIETRMPNSKTNLVENQPNVEAKIREVEKASISFYQSLPYSKVVHFTANQAILEAVGNAQKIHIIDFDIKDGMQWPNLMQSLALRHSGPPQALKIMAIGSKSSQKTATTGKRLKDFAISLDIPFAFQMVSIAKIDDVNGNDFEVDPEDAVAVNAAFIFDRLIRKPKSLRCVLDVIWKLRPLVFTVIRTEADNDSVDFVKRFFAILSYTMAAFEANDAVFERSDLSRLNIERFLAAPALRNIVAREGEERVIRHVEADVWGSFMEHAGFRGVSFSEQARYQASLMFCEFPAHECFVVGKKGHALTVGWKSMPILSVSAWVPNTLESYRGNNYYKSRHVQAPLQVLSFIRNMAVSSILFMGNLCIHYAF